VTLFDADGELHAPATAALARQLVDLGVRAVVVAGSTGEASALDAGERLMLLEAVRAAVPDVPVLAGTGAPSAHQAAGLTAGARDHGADGFLVLSPPGTSDIGPYYDAVGREAGALPVFAYHFPKVSLPGIAVSQLGDLPVAALKDSSGDPERLLEELTSWDGPVYTGSSAILLLAGAVGCPGAILALANAEPELCIAAFAGDAAAQRALAEPHLAMRRSFPGGIKALTAKRFGTSAVARLG
jgi:4-hydroxy-tetrahydrodipicolinate synthase